MLIHTTQIAQDLDAAELALLEGGRAIAGETGNVDASGMFSVQVCRSLSLSQNLEGPCKYM